MVECEFTGTKELYKKGYRFNRYMVECELLSEFVNFYSNYVLIDTWWNVNTNKLGAGVEAVEVLIDTWWNVNF